MAYQLSVDLQIGQGECHMQGPWNPTIALVGDGGTLQWTIRSSIEASANFPAHPIAGRECSGSVIEEAEERMKHIGET